jgi:signal peptidase I
MEARISKLAITSFAIGLLSFIALPPLLALTALIVGFIALRKIKISSGSLRGKGMAITGVVLGGVVWLFIVAGLILAISIRAHYQPFRIPTASMEPAIKSGERAIIDRKEYSTTLPRRGDIVVYAPGEGKKKLYVKRIVGLPGEALEIKNGSIYIDGNLTPIPGLAKEVFYRNGGKFGQEGHPVKIPKYFYFVVGDNSTQSLDSRYHGYVNVKRIYGKVIAIYKDSRKEVAMELLRLFFEKK